MSFYRFCDACFNYHGRWERLDDGQKSHWTRPYVEFYCDADFTLKLDDGAGKYTVWLNGECVESENGVYRLDKESLVRLRADETANTVIFQGVETDGNVKRAPSRQKHILFIGDSLSHSPVSHTVLLPKAWNWDYTCIAQGSMALRVDRGYVNVPEGHEPFKGMSAAFFMLQNPCEQGEMVEYDFSSQEYPDMVMLNIGTNDHLTDETYAPGFMEVYNKFVDKLHGLYPDVPIYLLLPSADTVDGSGWRRNTIEKCAKECEAKYTNVTYISSRDWDVEISSDKVHPTTEGYRVYAEELMKAIKTK